MKSVSINDGRAVFGKDEYIYQSVLDDFKNAKFIGIMTFNISPQKDSYLLKSLRAACISGANASIITNIPKRFPSYYAPKYAVVAKDMIDLYKCQLNPADFAMRLNPYFNFRNHAKIIMTENIVYWGSSNFSDESSNNFECGTISTDKAVIKYLKDYLFPYVEERSVPYYKYNFAVAIANLESLIPTCQSAKQSLFYAAFEPWSDYDTNFEEKWLYRTTYSGVTIEYLRGFVDFFSQFEDALNIIDNIVDEYWDFDELPEQVEMLKKLYEGYKQTYDNFFGIISSLFENLEQMALYDVSEEASRKVNDDYGMEAYDEELDYYIDKAMNEAAEEYEDLIKGSEHTVRDALDNLDTMIQYLEQLSTSLQQLLEVNTKIDNTGVK